MQPLQATKHVIALVDTGVTNGETVTASIDTLGFDNAQIAVILGTSNTASNNPSSLALSEADTTDATAFADITEFVGDGNGGFTIPNADTANPNLYVFNVDLRGRKRHLKLTVTPTTTQAVVVHAQLNRSEKIPLSAADAGAHVLVNG